MSTRSRRPPPLPPREGAGVARVGLPVAGTWDTVVAAVQDITGVPEEIDRRCAAGELVLSDGTVVTPSTTYEEGRRRGGSAWTYRAYADETPVPGRLVELHRDENVLVVDKPPFLATMPRGSHVRETVLHRVRVAGHAQAAPAHRLDRLTSGVLLLTLRAEVRRAYQEMFAERRVAKVYEAVVRLGAVEARDLPSRVQTRVVKERGELRAREIPGEPNADTGIELLEAGEGWARVRLRPTTGRTHQLRVQLAGIGTPIVGDPLYGAGKEWGEESFDRPLALVARSLAFDDPLTGEPRCLTARREVVVPPPPTHVVRLRPAGVASDDATR